MPWEQGPRGPRPVDGHIDRLSSTPSDLDMGRGESRRPLTIEGKVEIAIFFEDFFDLPRVDVIMLPGSPRLPGGGNRHGGWPVCQLFNL